MLRSFSIGVDVGGTNIKAALVDKDGRIKRKIKVKTDAARGKSVVLDKIIKCIEAVSFGIEKKELVGIGIGVPGIIDRKKGRIIMLPNIPGFENFSLAARIRKKFGMPVLIENDASCVVLAEYLFGAGKGAKNLVCLTLGTGIGGGIIIDGKLYHGRGNAGEIGHITAEPKGIRCSCGNYGCSEEYISTKAFRRLAKKVKLGVTEPADIEKLARNGNTKALRVYSEIGRHLGLLLSDLVKVLDPKLILLGGGIAKSGNLILTPAKKELRKRVYFTPPKIRLAALGEWGGAIGSASMFLRK